ncbi:hypothetical protein GOODEAATRI_003542 [Goodea atripinnis]|uniref:Uncharacterized protein n=1 Tax=Goodea atripinnis TaxID=208336 RepID=A0ABV0MHM0_9TELE
MLSQCALAEQLFFGVQWKKGGGLLAVTLVEVLCGGQKQPCRLGCLALDLHLLKPKESLGFSCFFLSSLVHLTGIFDVDA